MSLNLTEIAYKLHYSSVVHLSNQFRKMTGLNPKNANAVAQKEQTAEEWKTINKSDFELKIKANEMRITELNVKMSKPAELFDPFYVKKIANLEKENRFLKARLEAYEKSQSKMGSN